MEAKRKPARVASGNYRYDSLGFNTLYRWMSYEHCDPPIDFDGILYDALELETKTEDIADLGCGPPWRLYDLYSRLGHRGRLIGIDPYPEQFDNLEVYEADMQDYQDFIEHADLLKGRMQKLPLEDSSIDRIISEYSMYLIPKDEQNLALNEIKRVIKPGGIFVVTTSGTDNKREQRIEEGKVAQILGSRPPRMMNANYNTIRAATHLRRHFHDVQWTPMHTYIVYRSVEDLEAKYFSLLSMKDQYDPIPRSSEYHNAIMQVFHNRVYPQLIEQGYVTDLCVRDLFKCRYPIDSTDK